MQILIWLFLITSILAFLVWLARRVNALPPLPDQEWRNVRRIWHVSQADGGIAFNFDGVYRDALTELRIRAPESVIVHVDQEMGVIFFKFAAKK